ncbi:hypothetical protein [Streptomyces nitrosporeus]|nr:hypothetical protein [Streptomyces nitrosporeus]
MTCDITQDAGVGERIRVWQGGVARGGWSVLAPATELPPRDTTRGEYRW